MSPEQRERLFQDFLLGISDSSSIEHARPVLSNTSFNLFSRADLIADYRVSRAVVGLDVGYGFRRFSEVRLGHDDGYFSANLQLGSPTRDHAAVPYGPPR